MIFTSNPMSYMLVKLCCTINNKTSFTYSCSSNKFDTTVCKQKNRKTKIKLEGVCFKFVNHIRNEFPKIKIKTEQRKVQIFPINFEMLV